MFPALSLLLALAAGPNPLEQSEKLASEALALAASQPEAALARARQAMALTADFEPTLFVTAGRKGEVVEDAYVAARLAYRRHRARLYQAVGESLARGGRQDAAARYLRRAVDLERTAERVTALARALVALGRGHEALAILLAEGAQDLPASALAVAEQAADRAGLPSLQAEIDRARLEALPVDPHIEARAGPFRVPERARLSTGAPFRLDGEGLTLVYVAEPACRTCSEDLELLKRLVPQSARLVVAPAVAEEDAALRRVLSLYRYSWPTLGGRGVVDALGVTAPALLAVARQGWSGAVIRLPFERTLPPALAALARTDVRETAPRAAWNNRPPDRTPLPPRPGLLAGGLAPGEDEPAPESFSRAVEAYRAGRAAEALRLFEALEAEGDGWLLPPEARLDRALCLAALGRREEARRLLLRTGDSRFQEVVDRTLETVGSPARRTP
jgi:tetratricopeptide (TPR) repeat protein